MTGPFQRRTYTKTAAVFLLCPALAACSALPAFGPTPESIVDNAAVGPVQSDEVAQYRLVDLTIGNLPPAPGRLAHFPSSYKSATTSSANEKIVASDALEIRIWEVGNDGLFASSGQNGTLFNLTVSNEGMVNVPYAGEVQAVGLTPSQLRDVLLDRYRGKTIEPEIAVRIVSSSARYATIVGAVKSSRRVEIPQSGTRLLDLLADAGGSAYPNWEIAVTVTRGAHSSTLTLDSIFAVASNNILVLPGDTIKVDYQPRRFSVFGAVKRTGNVEIDEAVPTLARLLAEAGGLDDNAAEPNSLFVFRVPKGASAGSRAIPVVYRLDFKRPDAFIVAEKFELTSSDIVFVANSDAKELQKLISTLLSPVFSAANGLQDLGL